MKKPISLLVYGLATLGLIAAVPFLLSFMTDDHTVYTFDGHEFRMETYARGLDTPWGMAFLPDGRLLVTERQGSLRVVGTDGTISEPLEGTPDVCACGQGGLLDVALHPDYAQNGWIYLAYSDRIEADGENRGFTALMRARLEGDRLVDAETLYEASPEFYTTRGQHFGSRIVFDDGYVFFGIGDRGQRDQAQDLSTPNGKIHRLHDDGRVPTDNPFVAVEGALPSIWSYGHRNPQGMDRHPTTGALWETEHGPRGGDELNRVEPGLNYGWPVITYGINYDGTSITDLTEQEGMEQPEHYWVPSIALCGITFYTGGVFPEWQNDLFITSLNSGTLHRVDFEGGTAGEESVVFEPGLRLRDVQTGPDGLLYLAVEGNPGRITRLVPAGS